MSVSNQKKALPMDLEKFAEIILTRDEKRDDNLSNEMANLAKQVSKLVTITALSEQQHKQHRDERDKTDKTLYDHGKRIYANEAQILRLQDKEKALQKRWDSIDKVKFGVLIVVIASAIIAYVGLNVKAAKSDEGKIDKEATTRRIN